MTDFFGSFARGFEGGNTIGDRLAARGIRKRTADAERQLLEGELTPEQYEQAIRDAQGRGFARFRDTDTVAEQLRTRGLDVLNRRDDRMMAEATADGRMVDAWQLARNRTARMGDVAGAAKVREGLNALDQAGQVTTVGGQRNYAPALARRAEHALAAGDLEGAQAADAAQRTQLDDFAQRAFNDALNQYNAGNDDAAFGVINTVVETLGLPFQFQIDNANSEGDDRAIAMVPKGEGGQARIMSEREFFQNLGGIADGSNTLKNLLGQITQQDETRNAREADLTKRAEEAVFKILTESGANPAAATQLATATQRARAAGVQQISTQDDGSILAMIGGQPVLVQPPVEGEGGNLGRPNWTFTNPRTGEPVDLDQSAASAVQEFSLAQQLAFDQGRYRISAEDRNARIAQIMQFTHTQLGRPGVAPAAAGMLLDAATSQQGDEEAIDAFAAAVDRLEGDGKNSRSSAVGPGQFIDSTMLSIARKHFPEATAEMDDAQILQLRTTNPEFMRNMIRAYAKDNIDYLRSNDVPVNPVTLYMGHHFGGPRAVEIFNDMRTNPQMSVVEAFTPKELRSNPYLTDPERNPSGTLVGVLGDWQQRQSALFENMTGRQVATLTAPAAPGAAGAAAPNGQSAPTTGAAPSGQAAPQVAVLPEAERLTALQQRQSQLEEFVRLAEAQAAPARRRPAAGLGGVVAMPAAIPGEGLSREDREALAQAREDLRLVRSEIQAAQLAARAAEHKARLESGLVAMRAAATTAGLPPRNTNGAP